MPYAERSHALRSEHPASSRCLSFDAIEWPQDCPGCKAPITYGPTDSFEGPLTANPGGRSRLVLQYGCGGGYRRKSQHQNHTEKFWGNCAEGLGEVVRHDCGCLAQVQNYSVVIPGGHSIRQRLVPFSGKPEGYVHPPLWGSCPTHGDKS